MGASLAANVNPEAGGLQTVAREAGLTHRWVVVACRAGTEEAAPLLPTFPRDCHEVSNPSTFLVRELAAVSIS